MKKTTEHPEGIPVPFTSPPPKPKRKMRHFYQGAPEYGRDLVGHGKSTMHGAGCLVTTLMSLALYMGAVDSTMTPGKANQLMKAIPGAFDGSNLYMHVGAKAVGLEAPEGERIRAGWGNPKLKQLLIDTIKAGDCAVLHVSTDGDVSDGGEHFVGAYAIEDDMILCTDSALGGPVLIPLATMEKRVMWKDKQKHYQICSVAPIRPA